MGELWEIILRRRQARRYEGENGETVVSPLVFFRQKGRGVPKAGVPVNEFRKSWKAACIADENTRLVKGDIAPEVRRLKKESGKDIVILGSGSIVSQLASEGLIDEYQVLVNPVVLGQGRTMFDGIKGRLNLKLTKTRAFGNGKVFLCYEPME